MTKIRVIIPVIQIVVAAGLIASNVRRPDPGGDTIPDSRVAEPDIQICWALNSPASMIAYLQRSATHDWLWTSYPLYPVINVTVFLSLVGALWYLVCLEATGGGRSVLTPRTGARRVADILAMVFGVALLVYADNITKPVYHQVGVSLIHLTWSLAIVAFYGHDLLSSFSKQAYWPRRPT